jgi:hypothetical protein
MSRAQGKGTSLSLLVHALGLNLAFLSIYQSVPELDHRVLVAPRAITFVNMHPRLHPIPPLQIPPSPPRLVVPLAARPEKDQRYWRNTTRIRAHPIPRNNHLGPIIAPSSSQRCPNSSHSITFPTTRVHHIGRAPLQVMTVRWRSRGNSTTTRDRRSLPRIPSAADITVPTPGLSR